MVKAIQRAGESYIPPSAPAIGGRLIEDCHASMQRELWARDPNGAQASKFGITYVSDGWEDVNHNPLVNSAYVKANDGGTYLRSVDTSGKTKDAKYLSELMIEDILTKSWRDKCHCSMHRHVQLNESCMETGDS